VIGASLIIQSVYLITTGMIIYATVSITNKHNVIIIGVIKTSLETLDRHPPYLISLLFLK